MKLTVQLRTNVLKKAAILVLFRFPSKAWPQNQSMRRQTSIKLVGMLQHQIYVYA